MNMMKRFVMLSTVVAIGFEMVVAINAQESDTIPPNIGTEVATDQKVLENKDTNTKQSIGDEPSTSQNTTILCPYHDGQHNGLKHDGTCKNDKEKHDGPDTHEKGQHSNRYGDATSDDAANNLQ